MSTSNLDLREAAKIMEEKDKRIAAGGCYFVTMEDQDTWLEMKQKEGEAEELLKKQALKVYAPLRKLAQAALYLAITAIVGLILYLIAAVIYLMFVYAPVALLVISVVGTVIILAVFVATGDIGEPPGWLVRVVQWKLSIQTKMLEKKRIALLKRIEAAEADKIENQLL